VIDRKIDIRHFPFPGFAASEESSRDSVKSCGGIMRGIIIRTAVIAENVQALRRLQAVEGYADLGMFEEAEAELRELEPAWFAFEPILKLRSRVYAGLNHCE
jgi:hypothetical protein